MSAQDSGKQAAARAALEFVQEGKVLGVGTGSTVNFLIDELATRGVQTRRRGFELEWIDASDSKAAGLPGAGSQRRR